MLEDSREHDFPRFNADTVILHLPRALHSAALPARGNMDPSAPSKRPETMITGSAESPLGQPMLGDFVGTDLVRQSVLSK